LTDSLKQKALSSVKWTAFETASRQAVQLGLAMILARLLTPAEFGVMAVAAVFLAVSNTLIGAGFGVALVQRQQLTDVETSSVFYFGLFASLVMAAAMFSAAPWVASFFDMPALEPVAKVLSLTFVIGSLGGVHYSLLLKKMEFSVLTRISLTSSVVSSLVAAALAWYGWGIWSLVAQSLTMTAVSSGIIWIWSAWRPKLVFSFAALRPLFRFGSFIVGADLLETVFGRAYTLLIGKFYTPSDLGFYSRADSTLALPNNFTSGIINQVAMPMFSAAKHDAALLQRAFRKAMRVTFYVHAPIIAGLFVTAEPLVLTLFGPKWAPAVPYLQILAFSGLCWLPVTVNYGYLKATGRSKAYFHVELMKKILFLTLAFITVQISIPAMLVAAVACSLVAYLITAHVAGRSVGYGWLKQVLDSWRPILASLCMVPVAASPLIWNSAPPGVILFAQVLIGAATYLIACRALRCHEQSEALVYLRSSLGRIAGK